MADTLVGTVTARQASPNCDRVSDRFGNKPFLGLMISVVSSFHSMSVKKQIFQVFVLKRCINGTELGGK